jgi:hypothetical protein
MPSWGISFPVRMIGRMERARRSRGVRLATLLAACLTSATAFGLHPEPAASATGSPPQIDVAGTRATDAGPHDCLACRAHRPLVSVSFLAVVPPLARSTPREFVCRPSLVPAFEPERPDGRAPPDLS